MLRSSLLAYALLSGTALAASGEIWVTNEKDDTISVIDVASLEVVRTIDVGAPQLSMHSIRELMHVDDLDHAIGVFTAAFTQFHTLKDGICASLLADC